MKRTYTIPLRKTYASSSKNTRTNKAVRAVKVFLKKHMKTEEVKLHAELNEKLWENGIKNPPAKIVVVCEKNDEGVVHANLEGFSLRTVTKESEEQTKEKPVKAAEEEKKQPAKEEATPVEKKETKETPAEEKKKPAKKASSSTKKKTAEKK